MKFIKKHLSWILFLSITYILLLTTFIIIMLMKHENVVSTVLKIVGLTIIVIIGLLIPFFALFLKKRVNERSNVIQKNINFYMENLVSQLSVGVIIIQPNGEIIWTSQFIEERFGKKIMNQNIVNLIPDFELDKKQTNFEKVITINEFVYQIKFISKRMIFVVKDITQEHAATHFYEIEKLVIGEIDIDNFQQYQSSLPEEELFSIQSTVINHLENLSKKYNMAFKQYANNKFIILTNRDNLNKMMLNSFEEFEKLKEYNIIKNTRISLSIGFGADSSNYLSLMEMAKEGLKQSQSRGGDQITIISEVERPKYFGSKSEIAILKSRTKIRNTANNLKLKLLSPKIENVIIYGHKIADLDAIGASYAVYEIAKAFGKDAYIQNHTFDNTGKKAIEKYIKDSQKIFISASKAYNLTTKNSLVVIVDCADETRVENPKVFQKIDGQNIFIFDHHRLSKLNDIINDLNAYVETSASSACEIITEMILFNNFSKHISKTTAQMLLNGIYLDTSQFKKSVSSRTFMAASILEDWGANIEESNEIMKMSQATNEILTKILANLKEVKPGYWLATYKDVAQPDVVSIAANEILRIEGRKAAFVIAKQPKSHNSENDTFKLSARSNGVNVQLIAEAVGGGGHFNSAAAVSDGKAKESIETFTDNVIQAIISTKEN